MHFRKQSIADSVAERIEAIADHVEGRAPMPAPRGATTVSLDRQANGDLIVTKSFANGESELLTISNTNSAESQPIPDGFIDVTPGELPGEGDGVAPGTPANGIVESAARGGDSLDALLRG